jgi:hypothetical protein
VSAVLAYFAVLVVWCEKQEGLKFVARMAAQEVSQIQWRGPKRNVHVGVLVVLVRELQVSVW